ncbi:MAG: hypothetical protein ACREHE_14665 [Rhizomicrobium sp.]
MDDTQELARCEALAEKAWSQMYEAAPHNVKDYYEDASLYIAQALQIARKLGLKDESVRLAARGAHYDAVFNSQFRYAGR